MIFTIYPHTGAGNRPCSRPVIDERGVFYPSALVAAEARGLSPSTAYMRARLAKQDWRFATPAEIAVAKAEIAAAERAEKRGAESEV